MRPPNPPWWSWPHAIGLDAAGIAVAWLALVSQSTGYGRFHVAAPPLFFGTWCLYLIDRARDVRGSLSARNQSAPHRFALQFPMWTSALVVVSGLAALAFATQLNWPELTAAGVVGIAVLAYYVVVEWSHRFRQSRFRPVVIGILFTCGIFAFPSPFAAGSPHLWIIFSSVAATFSANAVICASAFRPLSTRTTALVWSLTLVAAITSWAGNIPVAGICAIIMAVIAIRPRKIQSDALVVFADSTLFIVAAIAAIMS